MVPLVHRVGHGASDVKICNKPSSDIIRMTRVIGLPISSVVMDSMCDISHHSRIARGCSRWLGESSISVHS